jgi:hypothetical protein
VCNRLSGMDESIDSVEEGVVRLKTLGAIPDSICLAEIEPPRSEGGPQVCPRCQGRQQAPPNSPSVRPYWRTCNTWRW